MTTTANGSTLNGHTSRDATTVPLHVEARAVKTVDDLLWTATESGVPTLVKAAEKIRTQVDHLRSQLDDIAEEQRLRKQIDDLTAQLTRAKQQLKRRGRRANTNAPADPAVAEPSGPTGKAERAAIRAWAKANGLPCSDLARIPVATVAAYRAARRQEAAT